MKLLIKINIALFFIFALGLVLTNKFAETILQENAKREVLTHARLMMEAAMTARNYTTKEIKPLLTDMLATKFLPQSVPSYAATQSFLNLRENYPDYTYKEATLNPTNPRDRVVEWESDIVQNLRDHPSNKEFVGERQTATGPSLFLARPIQVKDNQCLTCHSTADNAPKTMLTLYGTDNGFGWKLGEIVGSQIVSVPLSVPLQQADNVLKTLTNIMLGTFAGILLCINVLIYFMVIRPINKISNIAITVSEGKMNVDYFNITGKDEIAHLSTAFNRMRRSLDKAMAMLNN